ncbi:MAG: hypothetical protein ACP6IS_03610 [Candidatus Asgardarchaeia archaeon]
MKASNNGNIKTIYEILDLISQILKEGLGNQIVENLEVEEKNKLRLNLLNIIEQLDYQIATTSDKEFADTLNSIKRNLMGLFKERERAKSEVLTKEKEIVKEEITLRDPWGIIESTKNLIKTYSKSLDTVIPLFLLEVIEEIHTKKLPPDAIRIPSITLREIINKLLREAPYFQLLQKIHETSEVRLLPEEKVKVSELVNAYHRKFLGSKMKEEYAALIIDEAKMFLEAFNWGDTQTEKRILQLLYEKAMEHIKKAEEEKKMLPRTIHATTAILLSRISVTFTQLPRISERLRRMKP